MKNWLGFHKQDIEDDPRSRAQPAIKDAGDAAGAAKSAQSSNASAPAELASCDIKYAIGFSILSPFVGYSYTGRFKALGVFLATGVAVLVGLSYTLSEKTLRSKRVQISVGLGISAITAADNSRAILSARRHQQRMD